MSEQHIPTDLIELQRARDAAYEAIARRAGHLTDEEHARLWAEARDAVEALHAHPAMASGVDRVHLMTRLRIAAA
ncbi:hypothetical protein [Embleya sp. NBC_00896]|uniref:hypothetical protein n=1 Tax=Embleya sp. NBC_00896 TaxID=2975961 RepID=UPI0038640534|nr:hypothetical protein OG928_05230 [Embleya sp. NBC_00896]